MSYWKLLSLQLSQAEILIEKSKRNNYSDKSKAIYHGKIIDLFAKVKASIDPSLTEAKVFEKKVQLDFIFKSLEFLKDSTLNSMPYEVVGCLNHAMGDWIDKDRFIIVTGLQNQLYAFSYDLNFAKNNLFYDLLEAEYGVTFDQLLVQINLPSALSRDYLSSVALYHELGHFVDLQYDVSVIGAHIIENSKIRPKSDFEPYFPYLSDPTYSYTMLKSHVAEYFCDLFAAQYVGESLNLFLEFITHKQSVHGPYHPATTNRVSMVADYVSGQSNPVLELLQLILNARTAKTLQKRFAEISSDDFYKMIPYIITNEQELHGIIAHGWQVWTGDFAKFDTVNSRKMNLEGHKIYHIVNGLIEKSIGNYFVVQSWNQNKI